MNKKTNKIQVRPYLSHSQMSSFKFSKEQFLQTYYYGKFQNSIYLDLGKRLATALEFREKGEEQWIIDIVDQIPDAPKREFKIKTDLGDIPCVGILDGYFPKENKIYEYKSGQKASMASWRKQMLFYSLLLFQSQGKIPKRIELYHAPTILNENQQLIFRGDVNKYEINIELKDIILFAAEVKKTWEEIQKVCQREYDMYGTLPVDK